MLEPDSTGWACSRSALRWIEPRWLAVNDDDAGRAARADSLTLKEAAELRKSEIAYRESNYDAAPEIFY